MAENLEEAIIKTVNAAKDSVVHVTTVSLAYDRFLEPLPVKGAGSGFILSSDGLIVTNYHVVSGAKRLETVLPDGRRYSARTLATDRFSDLALLKIDAQNLKPLRLGDSDRLKVGQIVLAMGNPFGLLGQPTVTIGVVSAKERAVKTRYGIIEGLIQTDAAVNPGNSGGPLVDLKGTAVGVITAMIPYAQGIGFAIPASSAARMLESLRKYGKALRPWIGIYGADLTPQVARRHGLPVRQGVIVVETAENGPARRAGIRRGDVITSVDGKPVGSTKDLRHAVEQAEIGEWLSLKIFRAGKTLSVKTQVWALEG